MVVAGGVHGAFLAIAQSLMERGFYTYCQKLTFNNRIKTSHPPDTPHHPGTQGNLRI
ncbi:MAG: hypothetical protein J7545_11790 [Roseofilum sp. SBFL]|uniref:hypothetical protein n=1 Tax=unclassified Roseofilum TaxID=2620099 RepID=UPI001B0DA9A5|nr:MULTISPECIES: hypothetical protein [unclassified Roseofilum]MBP0014787.1 hypothetical protein [Roseofilum sp. SID3]MBP0024148.1 hypothetical protein [Roseofilum sp. SID2]MBP0042643.1 hypothetical protein [Roseofilum sp. SBFL]